MTTLAIKKLSIKWDEPNVLPARGWLKVKASGTDLEDLIHIPRDNNDEIVVGFYVAYPILEKHNPGAPIILVKAYLRLRDYSWNYNMEEHTYVHTPEEARAWIKARINKALADEPRLAGMTI